MVLAYSNCALCIPSHKGWSTDVFCHTCTISPHILFHGTTINPTWNTELFDKHLISYYELCFVKNSVVVLWDSLPRKTQQASVCTVSMVLYVGYHFRLYLWFVPIIVFMCMYRVQNVFLRCPTPRLHCFLSSHWPSFRFLSFMAFFIPSIQLFFGLPRALFCFGIHFIAILGSLSSAILWTWPYHESWFFSISFIILSSSPICCLIVTFLILSFLDILEDLLRASISVANTIFKCNMIFNGGQQRN